MVRRNVHTCVLHVFSLLECSSSQAMIHGFFGRDTQLGVASMSASLVGVQSVCVLKCKLQEHTQPPLTTHPTSDDVEGGEQGDPLMPLLFSIGIQSALEEVSQSLLVGERLCAFLDDLYLLCEPGRVRHLYDLVSESLHRNAGIQLHQGKTRVWNRSGTVPDNVDSLGEEVWRTDGIKILGTPLGNAQFVAEHTQERLEEEQRLWDAIPSVPDLQCAWQILVQSANPRANHTIRTLPPRLSLEYARGHDKGMWDTAKGLLQQLPGSDEELREAEMVARLPMRMGGLGLRSAERCADAACWASWADALEMIHQRTPAVADMVVRTMEEEAPAHGCLSDLQTAARRLDNEGFWWRPSWKALRDGRRPPTNTSSEPGEWLHGWQYWASSISDTFFRKSSLLSSRAAASRAHLRSHSGCNAGAALAHAPTTRSTRSRRSCSACCSWNDCNCLCLSQKRHVKGATVPSTPAAATEQHAHSADA